jgi:tetraacyldisaccharide 4'-kinase
MQPSGPIPLWLGFVPSLLYSLGIRSINRRYDRGKSVITLDRPVISVGNLSVGGTGKTPLSILMLRWLLEAGHQPALAMRGYGSSDGSQSDEARLYARELPELDIVARPDRLTGLFELLGTDRGESINCILLDDGFQHRRIARQFDVLLIDARHPPMSDRLLPAGWLREPFSSVTRAHAVVITHADALGAASEIKRAVESLGVHPIFATCRHVWTHVSVHTPDSTRIESVEFLRGKSVVATCAIARPDGFMSRLKQLACVRDSLILRDHNPYAKATVDRLISLARTHNAHAVVCTAKDWSKLSKVDPKLWPCPVIVPELQMRFDSGEAELKSRLLEVVSTPVE